MSPSNVTSRSDARTIALLRRKLAATEMCLNLCKNKVVEIIEFVKDTDINDSDDVVISNNFVISISEEILVMDAQHEETIVDSESDSESDSEMGSESDGEIDSEMGSESDGEIDSESDSEIDSEMEDGEFIDRRFCTQLENITIDGVHYFHDKYGIITGHTHLLMKWDRNGDMEPIGFFEETTMTIIRNPMDLISINI